MLQYIRFGIFQVDEVIPYVILNANKLPNVSDRGHLLYKSYIGYPVKMNARNLQLFAWKGTKCAKCGIQGEYFALEAQFSDWPERYYCLNLYSKDNVLFTKDHIIPKSAGGSNSLENLQPLCINCNARKANSVDKKSYRNGVLKLNYVKRIKKSFGGKKYKFCLKQARRAIRQTRLPLHITPTGSYEDDGEY